VGDGFNVAHSLLFAAGALGLELHVATPPDYEPNETVVARAQRTGRQTGAKIEVYHDARAAAERADVIYTDSWISMGQEAEKAERLRVFPPYQVNQALVALARPDAIVLHCLPAHRGEEITDEVMDGPHSAVFDQAENRLHAQKAVLTLLIG
jgi:ornithine carbamoyltransferase